jgi:hypothetical protein
VYLVKHQHNFSTRHGTTKTCTRGLIPHVCHEPCSQERVAYLLKHQNDFICHPRRIQLPPGPGPRKQKQKKTRPHPRKSKGLAKVPDCPCVQPLDEQEMPGTVIPPHADTIRQLEKEVSGLRTRNKELEEQLSQMQQLTQKRAAKKESETIPTVTGGTFYSLEGEQFWDGSRECTERVPAGTWGNPSAESSSEPGEEWMIV